VKVGHRQALIVQNPSTACAARGFCFLDFDFCCKVVGDMLSLSVTCCRPLNRVVPPCWAGHFLSERQKVTKKRVA
ncbi:hypothetical protein, partial [Cupriavidus consociatus]|uniref:hypothetical protein n=1 Tax=Cupriavidus consociatus TaxID=2821357 RepID=UPI001AE38DA4